MSRWWLSRRELPELHHPMVHHCCCGMLHRPEGLRVVRTRGMKHESRQRSAGGDLLHHSVISLRSRWRKQRSAGPRSTHAQVALGLTDTNVGNGSVGYRVRAIGNSTPLACHKVWLAESQKGPKNEVWRQTSPWRSAPSDWFWKDVMRKPSLRLGSHNREETRHVWIVWKTP